MVVGISLLLLAVLVVGLVVVLRMGRAGASMEDETPPPSSDFVAPVSSGAFRFRTAEETPETFHDRLKQEDADIASSKRNPNA